MSKTSSKPPTKPPTSSFAAFLNALSWSRLQKDPDFDAGLNSSSAWTEALTTPEGVARTSRGSLAQYNVNALSDDEADEEEDAKSREGDEDPLLEAEEGKPARALYTFEGKPEFRELTAVQAGDRLDVLREEVGDGWSLVKHFGSEGQSKPEVGLLPQSYYTVRPLIHVLNLDSLNNNYSLRRISRRLLTWRCLLPMNAFEAVGKLQVLP